MTPEQKIKWAIMNQVAEWEKPEPPVVNADNVDELFDGLQDEDDHWDAQDEIRSGEVETGLRCEHSRHYEADAVAAKMPDGTWVGWTYWYGGGKHGQPESIEWMYSAYAVDCIEEEKMVTVRTFSRANVTEEQ